MKTAMNAMRTSLPILLGLLCLSPQARADLIQQGSSYTITTVLISSGDHISGLTGSTVTAKISKAGGAGAASTNAVVEVDGVNLPGVYKLTLSASETNTLGPLDVHFSASGADPNDGHHQVVAFNPQDSAA